jgi:hypothetical protein
MLALAAPNPKGRALKPECSSKSGVKPPSALVLAVEQQPGGTSGTSTEKHHPVRC